MTKAQVKEALREAIRQARIQEDQGDSSQRDRIIHLTALIQRVSKLDKTALADFAESYGLTD